MKHTGISSKEANELRKVHGYNEITEMLHVSPLKIFLRQIKTNYIIYLLIFAMIVSFYVDKHITAYTILAVILIVVVVGFIMEFKAESAIKALKQMIMPMTTVIRDGKEQNVPSRELVPGDIIIVHVGDKVPADCVILDAKDLRLNESILTGESKEITKHSAPNENDYKPEHQMYMGTFVVGGRAYAKVSHIGMNTEFGKIADMISSAEKEITLQKKVNTIVKYMALNAVFFAIVTGMIMVFRDAPLTGDMFVEILIVIIALSVSAFPEGFPVVLITTLAAGARRMAAKNAIVNRMSIIETLGETTVICTDKTGTLTKGEMTVKKMYTDGKLIDVTGTGYDVHGNFLFQNKEIRSRNISTLLKAGVICNDSRIEQHPDECKTFGSPTEIALLIMAGKANMFKEEIKGERIEEIPFSSHTKIMAVVHEEQKKKTAYVKGAPEIVLQRCTHYLKGGKRKVLTEALKRKILKVNKDLTGETYRTLGLAYKKADKNNFDKKLTFIGLVGMEDPPRPEVKKAIYTCLKSGISVKMLTGDNKDTASAIAKEVGLHGKIIEGNDLDHLTDAELQQVAKEITIFARVRPEHKIKIVRALKENGEIVSMTGDGVNDAPALKESHIGIAMGKNGTDVSREVSDLVLKDDNFATIVEAVTEGRTIFKNIQKVSVYQISITLTQLFFIFIAIVLQMPLPLIAIQILFVNILSDEITAIMLGFNPPSFDVMEIAPRKGSALVDAGLFKVLAIATFVMTTLAMGTFTILLNVFNTPLEVARTTAFLTIVLFGVMNAFTFRSFRYPVYELPFAANKYIVYAAAIALIFTWIVIYTPAKIIFETTPISLMYWGIAIGVSLIAMTLFDVFKVINRRYRLIDVH